MEEYKKTPTAMILRGSDGSEVRMGIHSIETTDSSGEGIVNVRAEAYSGPITFPKVFGVKGADGKIGAMVAKCGGYEFWFFDGGGEYAPGEHIVDIRCKEGKNFERSFTTQGGLRQLACDLSLIADIIEQNATRKNKTQEGGG